MADNEGECCTICGGMVPKAEGVRLIFVDGKSVGIGELDRILEMVADKGPAGPAEVKEALLSAVKAVNYVPTKKSDAYADALYDEYPRFTRQR